MKDCFTISGMPELSNPSENVSVYCLFWYSSLWFLWSRVLPRAKPDSESRTNTGLSDLEVLYDLGLRLSGPVWNHYFLLASIFKTNRPPHQGQSYSVPPVLYSQNHLNNTSLPPSLSCFNRSKHFDANKKIGDIWKYVWQCFQSFLIYYRHVDIQEMFPKCYISGTLKYVTISAEIKIRLFQCDVLPTVEVYSNLQNVPQLWLWQLSELFARISKVCSMCSSPFSMWYPLEGPYNCDGFDTLQYMSLRR